MTKEHDKQKQGLPTKDAIFFVNNKRLWVLFLRLEDSSSSATTLRDHCLGPTPSMVGTNDRPTISASNPPTPN